MKLPGISSRRPPSASLERWYQPVATRQKQGVIEIAVAPIFLAIGGHMRKDLPALIEATHQTTGIAFRLLPVLGESDTMIAFIAARVLGMANG